MKIFVKGQVLKRTILMQGYSISKFAQNVEIGRSYMYSILSGRRNPSPELAKRIATLLNDDVGTFFFYGNEEEFKKIGGVTNCSMKKN